MAPTSLFGRTLATGARGFNILGIALELIAPSAAAVVFITHSRRHDAVCYPEYRYQGTLS